MFSPLFSLFVLYCFRVISRVLLLDRFGRHGPTRKPKQWTMEERRAVAAASFPKHRTNYGIRYPLLLRFPVYNRTSEKERSRMPHHVMKATLKRGLIVDVAEPGGRFFTTVKSSSTNDQSSSGLPGHKIQVGRSRAPTTVKVAAHPPRFD